MNIRSQSLLLIALLTGLAACGGGSSEQPSENNKPEQPALEPQPVPDPAPDPEPSMPDEPPTTSVVSVDLGVQQYIGDISELQRNKFFNVHTRFDSDEWPSWLIETFINDYNVDHGRSFWSPISVSTQAQGSSKYPSTEFAKNRGPGSISSYYANSKSKLVSNRLVITEHPEKVISPGNDPIEGARWIADYFTHYYDDVSRPRFYEPMNEPFVHTEEYRDQYNNSDADTRYQMALWFKEAGKEISSRPELADLKVVGYSSAWPSMELWDFRHWRERMQMFMDVAGEHLDGFSTHLYDGINVKGVATKRSGSNSMAVLDLIETYSHFKWDEVKPHAITEYGSIIDRPAGEVAYDATIFGQKISTMNHILLELMAREDRLLISIPFNTGLASWYWKKNDGHPYKGTTWRPNRDNLEKVNGEWRFVDPNARDNYIPNINMLFFDFWKDVEGRRVKIVDEDPDVQTAAFVNGTKAYVILSNLEEESKEVQLNISEMTGYRFTSVELERLKVPSDSPATLTTELLQLSGEVDGETSDLTRLTLAPSETVKFTIELDGAIQIDSTLQKQNYYADEHLLPIVANQALNFQFHDIDLSSSDTEGGALLRMSIGRKHSKSKQPELRVNGTVVPVPNDWPGYSQATRDDFFGAIEIPVPVELITPDTHVALSFPDSDGRVSSLVLVVNQPIEPIAVSSIEISNDITLEKGKTGQLTASVLPANAGNKGVQWNSSNTSIATVDATGLVTATGVGVATISASSENGVEATVLVTVKEASKNLLAALDPGFENGSLSPWTKQWQTPNSTTFDFTNPEAAKESNVGLHITTTDDSAPNGLVLPDTQLPQLFGEAQGRKFKLSFDLKVNNYAGNPVAVKFLMVAQGNWSDRIEVARNDLVINDQWTRAELLFDEADWSAAASSGVNSRMELFFNTGTGPIDAFIDNISIEIVQQ